MGSPPERQPHFGLFDISQPVVFRPVLEKFPQRFEAWRGEDHHETTVVPIDPGISEDDQTCIGVRRATEPTEIAEFAVPECSENIVWLLALIWPDLCKNQSAFLVR